VGRVFVTGGSGFVGGRLIAELRRRGDEVRALARSESAAARVRELGAEPVPGDLSDPGAIRDGAEGCELAFHAAARADDWGRPEDFERDNVLGTRNVLEGCAGAGVHRLVHVGTEAALMAGQPLVQVDETAPLRPDSPALYPATKARAEQEVLGFAGPLERVVVRPRFVWGPDDTSVLAQLVALVRAGRFAWIGGGRHLTATTHVDNTVHGLLLGAERGRSGGVYFVTDGEPVGFREFVTALLATQGVQAPSRSVPLGVAKPLAAGAETAWRTLPLRGRPPLTRFAVWASGLECTIRIDRARAELGYEPVKTRDAGLSELRAAA
jgi:nucleoside-diphosphate-sugar epimerase